MFQTLANIERKISEMGKLRKAKKEAHKKNEADFLVRKNYINSKEFMNENTESDEVTETVTPTKKATKADWINVRQHLDNKIYFKGNRSGNINADKGDIDTVIELIESMPVLPKCVKISVAKTGKRKGLKTLFVNINSKYGGIPTNQKHAIDLLAKLKFEAVMP